MLVLVELHGAVKRDDDSYIDRGPVYINKDMIAAVYDHTVLLTDGCKIRIMETAEEGVNKLCIKLS